MSSLITQISKLTTFLKQSTQKAAAFTDLASALTGKPLTMIAEVSTCWNSTFAILSQAYQLRETIRILCERHSLSHKYNLSETEWDKVKQICDFLEPLNKATKRMSVNNHVSMMLAAPAYLWLMEKLRDVSYQYVCFLCKSNLLTFLLFNNRLSYNTVPRS
jgi:hypothetical protein